MYAVIDEEDHMFSRIAQTKILHDTRPATYERIKLAMKAPIAKFHKEVSPYLKSQDWQLDYAEKVLKRMKIQMTTRLEESSSNTTNLHLPHWKTLKNIPKLGVMYPGMNAEFVVTDRGDMERSWGELREFGTKWPETFKLPKFNIKYPDGVEMRTVLLSSAEE